MWYEKAIKRGPGLLIAGMLSLSPGQPTRLGSTARCAPLTLTLLSYRRSTYVCTEGRAITLYKALGLDYQRTFLFKNDYRGSWPLLNLKIPKRILQGWVFSDLCNFPSGLQVPALPQIDILLWGTCPSEDQQILNISLIKKVNIKNGESNAYKQTKVCNLCHFIVQILITGKTEIYPAAYTAVTTLNIPDMKIKIPIIRSSPSWQCHLKK